MGTYVMADLHGRFTELNMLLNKVEFSDLDKLIIAGDICDRGKENYEMLRWMESKPNNVEFIKGNHEEEYIDNINILTRMLKEIPNIIVCYRELINKDKFFDCYGTIWQLINEHKVTYEQLVRWADMMYEFPYIKELSVNNKNYLIVHAGYMDMDSIINSPLNGNSSIKEIRFMAQAKEIFCTSARSEALFVGGKRDTTVIAGHNPTIIKGDFYNSGRILRHERPEINSVIYDIDCGAGFLEKCSIANIACIRLEDEKIFYLR